MRRKVSLPWGFTVYPNLYVILVGPSGSRKGTAMGPCYKMLADLGIKMAAEAITREALIRELKKSSDTQAFEEGGISMHSSLTIFSQELTVFLGYSNMQLMADLCDWFDCRERWVYRTKNMGEDDIIGVWVNLIGATTPDLLQTTLPRDAIGGGLTARMIIVFAPRKWKTVPDPHETEEERVLREKLLRDLEKISMMSGEFKLGKDYMRAWTDWYHLADKSPPFSDVRLSGYVERRPSHILKLSMIMSSSRSDSMVVEVQDLNRATRVLEHIEEVMPRAFSGIGKTRMADVMTRVISFMAMNKETTFDILMQNFYFDADKREMIGMIETLRSMGAIRMGMEGNRTVIQYTGKEVLT